MKNEKASGEGSQSKEQTALINFLNKVYDRSADISILKKYATGAYPAVFCALAKAKIRQVEQQRGGVQ